MSQSNFYEDDITPSFLKDDSKESTASKALRAAETAAVLSGASGAGGSSGAIGGASGAIGVSNGAGSVVGGVTSFRNSFSGNNALSGKKGKNGRLSKKLVKSGASIAIIVVLFFAGLGLILLVPVIAVTAISYGLQDSLGFTDTSGVLEKQAAYIAREQLALGEFNSNYAKDLEVYGIEVGQTTLAGEFVRTDNYIANLGGEKQVASSNDYYSVNNGDADDNTHTTALAVRFNGEVIPATDFVAKLESDPKLYGAFAKATDITGRFYHSNEVNKVYKDLGISRNNFSTWRKTGNSKKDNEKFAELYDKAINKAINVTMGGYYDDCSEGDKDCTPKTFDKTTGATDDAEQLTAGIVDGIKGEDVNQANQRAASLLNTAISATEPYAAAATFNGVGEVLDCAKIDKNCPVDPLMTTLSTSTPITVTDVKTCNDTDGCKDVIINKSVLKTRNFLAAVGNQSFSAEDAANFSRDRVIEMNGGTNVQTKIASKEAKQYNIMVENSGSFDATNAINSAKNSVSATFYEKPSEITKTAVGGNRVVMGGSFLSNTINSRTLGAMPSDKETVLGYREVIDEVLARRAEAERATLSPFDITSKHTFLGNIVHKLGTLMITSFSESESVGRGVISSVAGLFNESISKLTGNTAVAKAKEHFLVVNGNCPTAKSAANVVGDVYCTTHNTIATSRMGWGLEDYKKELKNQIDEDGGIIEDGYLGEFVILAMGRETTVGVEDSNICESWKELQPYSIERFLDALSNIVGLYKSCKDVPLGVSTGASFTLSSENNDMNDISLYSSYILYDKVSSLLAERKSKVAAFEESYYAKHPKDNSPAGILARRSGMSKNEAEIALNYANYLNFIAKYNPDNRYMFKDFVPEIDNRPFFSDIIAKDKDRHENLIGIITKRSSYRDLRTRTMSIA